MKYQFEKSGMLKALTAEELAEIDADPNAAVIVLDRGITEDDRPYWVYVAVRPSKYEAFCRSVRAQEQKNVADYGEILRYGFDEEVPGNVKEEMYRTYGCDDNYMQRLEQDIRSEQAQFLEKQEGERIGDIVAMLKKKQQ